MSIHRAVVGCCIVSLTIFFGSAGLSEAQAKKVAGAKPSPNYSRLDQSRVARIDAYRARSVRYFMVLGVGY